MDYGGQKIQGGYKSLVILLQGITVAAIMALIPLPEVLKLGGLSGATRIRWPLCGVA